MGILKIFFVSSLILISGCTATIKSESFITQDKNVSPITENTIQDWQRVFSNYNLSTVSLVSIDRGATIQGVFFDRKDSTELIYFIPGNGMSISKGGIDAMKDLAELGHDMIIFDRRGLGASSGNASVENLLTDANQQVAYIHQNIKPSKFTVHGYSLGSFIATQVAKTQNVDALVLQGAATNAQEWIDERLSWLMKPFITVNVQKEIEALDNKDILANDYTGPLLVISAELDEQVPSKLSQSLYDSSSSNRKELILVKGASHGSMFSDETTLLKYKNFLNSFVSSKPHTL
ncbi:alpha/beta hydrolase [Pseudoalteromonas sp. MTN2-4]|uniref:alpha/beta hydrolase n=1 Tax=Pseudoalteromonas sp. MTN2-4 TaxID=3056555 RepID=UPI0036F417AE